ncbi:RagB/SusD family nutrient uptake outer membrane protein [Tenacibaculum halocynthiae]|uniref:RagB/SusD family nutrient uptake outer membrane protein n=1 Tax=Tenacibaculum halocynthiae TaxID=1254437 RepID=UPI00389474EB
MKNIKYLIGALFVSTTILVGCGTENLNPALEQDKIVEGSIKTDAELAGVLANAYDRMTASSYYGRDYIIYGEVRTDNVFANGNSGRFQTPATYTQTPSFAGIWTQAYRVISNANIVIGQDAGSLGGDQAKIAHIKGQAYVVRALAHFDLVKAYGQQHTGGTLGVPYITKFKDPNNVYPSRETVDQNKASILADLQKGFDMMSNAFFDGSKTTINKYAAKALESRVAVYFKMWPEAKLAAEAVINSGKYSIISQSSYINSFAVDAAGNSIFELANSSVDRLGSNSLGFIYKGSVYGDIEVLPNASNLYAAGDVRASVLGLESGKMRNLKKYPALNGDDNTSLIRYEEVILNYAEALMETSGDALTQLNKITAQRGAPALTGTVTKDIILEERRKELIFEGFRFDDLMRTGKNITKIDSKQNISATINYGDSKLAFPIPVSELDANSNMIQNKGY